MHVYVISWYCLHISCSLPQNCRLPHVEEETFHKHSNLIQSYTQCWLSSLTEVISTDGNCVSWMPSQTLYVQRMERDEDEINCVKKYKDRKICITSFSALYTSDRTSTIHSVACDIILILIVWNTMWAERLRGILAVVIRALLLISLLVQCGPIKIENVSWSTRLWSFANSPPFRCKYAT